MKEKDCKGDDRYIYEECDEFYNTYDLYECDCNNSEDSRVLLGCYSFKDKSCEWGEEGSITMDYGVMWT